MLLLPPGVVDHKDALVDFMHSIEVNIDLCQDFELFLCAFVHKSYASDFKELYNHNERLEFVGDAVLGSVIAKSLFLSFPQMQESTMTLYKIALVREETLAIVAKKIGLNQYIFISKGEEKNNGRHKPSIISDALEALIGYIFIDLGYAEAEKFVQTYVYPEIQKIQNMPVKSYKTMAQEKVQKLYKTLPSYTDYEQEVDNKWNVLLYRSEIAVEGKVLAIGTGTNKKKAQEDAAKNYYEQASSNV